MDWGYNMPPTRDVRPWEPRPSKPEPDRAEIYRQLGLNVTICLALKCWKDNCIVTVSDRRLSYSDYVEATDDATLKAFQLTPGWGLLFSADDVSPITGIIADVRARLRNPDWPKKQVTTLKAVRESIVAAYM